MKKIILIIGVSLFLMNGNLSAQSVYDGTRAPMTHGTGTQDDPYLIENAQHLAWLAYLVNVDYSHETAGKYYLMTTDIDLNGSEDNQWYPMGLGRGRLTHGTMAFQGTFDGGYHTISNLYINMPNTDLGTIAFFDKIQNAAIKNLKITGSVSGNNASAFVGYMYDSEIEWCISDVDVNAVKSASGVSKFLQQSSITETCNMGDVHSDTEYAAGIANAGSGIVENCYNTGNISSDLDYYSPTLASAVAGIVHSFVGASAFVKNCYNIGAISCASGNNAGLVAAMLNPENLTNCYYLNTCGDNVANFGESMTSEEMKNTSFVNTLNNGTDVWIADNEPFINNGYPILNRSKWDVEEYSYNNDIAMNVYPNPVDNEMNISALNLRQVEFFNTMGQLVMKISCSNIDETIKINTSNLGDGIYFVKAINAEGGTGVRKLIINH